LVSIQSFGKSNQTDRKDKMSITCTNDVLVLVFRFIARLLFCYQFIRIL
ncbi:hypothetical protein X975_05667, partial [Stegodyphus mimosarum]